MVEKKLRKTTKPIFFIKKIISNGEVKKENEKKRRILTRVNNQNPWLGSLDYKHKMISNKRNTIKRMRVKIKKNIEGATNSFWFEVKLKRKITLIKGKQIKRMMTKLEKNNAP